MVESHNVQVDVAPRVRLVKRDGQQALLDALCERLRLGEGVEGRFFYQKRKYLFLGNYKCWTMTNCPGIDLYTADEVVNLALPYRARRNFETRQVTQAGAKPKVRPSRMASLASSVAVCCRATCMRNPPVTRKDTL